MTPQESEAQDNDRKRKAAEFVEHCKRSEADAIRELARAREQLKRAREKYEEIFHECENRAVERRRRGLIDTGFWP